MAISLFFLERYGLSHKTAWDLSSREITLLDFFCGNQKRIKVTHVKEYQIDEVLFSLKQYLDESEYLDNIFEETAILNEIKMDFKKIDTEYKKLADLENALLLKKINNYQLKLAIDKYKSDIKLPANLYEKILWEAFIVFYNQKILTKNELIEKNISDDSINILLRKKLITIKYINELVYVMNEDNLNLELQGYVKRNIQKCKKVEERKTQDILKKDNQLISFKELFLMKNKNVRILCWYLEGYDLYNMAEGLKINLINIVEKIELAFKNIPKVEEVEKYRTIYETYNIGADIFIRVFNIEPGLYKLLTLTCIQGRKSYIIKDYYDDYESEIKSFLLSEYQKTQSEMIEEQDSSALENDIVARKGNRESTCNKTEKINSSKKENDTILEKVTVVSKKNKIKSSDKEIILKELDCFKDYPIEDIVLYLSKLYQWDIVELQDYVDNELNVRLTKKRDMKYKNQNTDFIDYDIISKEIVFFEGYWVEEFLLKMNSIYGYDRNQLKSYLVQDENIIISSEGNIQIKNN